MKKKKEKTETSNLVETGETNETLLLQLKCKLYRFNQKRNEWLERGNGTIKFLQHEVSNICRMVLRENGTGTLRLNHYLSATTKLSQGSNDRSWIWAAQDFSDNESSGTFYSFAIRLTTKAFADQFKSMFTQTKEVTNQPEGERKRMKPVIVEEVTAENVSLPLPNKKKDETSDVTNVKAKAKEGTSA